MTSIRSLCPIFPHAVLHRKCCSAVIKEHYRGYEKNQGKKTVIVSIMPCTAKKMEILRPDSVNHGERNTDWVITTTELIRMIKNSGIDFASLDSEACDMPFGFGSGGGVIFGVTGGVTEAVLRRLVDRHDKVSMDAHCRMWCPRETKELRSSTVQYKVYSHLNVCVASGLANARSRHGAGEEQRSQLSDH